VTLDRQPALAGCSRASDELPVAASVSGRVVSLPMHPYLADSQIETIVAAF
jgi:dTDP-4-amino-4,6-dideoxygalactose transaminase